MWFVDNKVLIYAASPSAEDAEKRRRAQYLLREGGLAVSVQVLQEFYSQVPRASRADPLSPSQVLRFCRVHSRVPVQDVTLAVFRTGVALSQRFRLSYWDGAILAAAHVCGCDAVYSEDLSDRQDYGPARDKSVSRPGAATIATSAIRDVLRAALGG